MDGTGELFYRQVARLAPRWRVATYALRDSADRMDDLVADLAAVVGEAGGGEPATIVGESFGGALALSFAIAKPELVRALVVVNSFPRFLPQVRLRLAILGVLAIPWGAMSVVRRFTASRLHSSHTSEETIGAFLERTRRTTKEGYLNRLRILERYDVRDDLGRLRPPVLFLAADEDHLIPSVEQARRMATRAPDATLRVLEGHGHACLLAPDVDLDAILAGWRDALPADASTAAA